MGPGVVGTFNGPGNNGENWAKLFDNFIGGAGPWGSGTSKICCGFDPGVSSVTVTSSLTRYSLTGYAIANGNDSPGRRPTGWRLFGSNDGFTSENVLLDTVVPADINGGTGWTQNNEVGEVTLSSATDFYSSFRIIWDTSVSQPTFQVGELELIGTAIPEPSAFSLLGLAGLALTARRRR